MGLSAFVVGPYSTQVGHWAAWEAIQEPDIQRSWAATATLRSSVSDRSEVTKTSEPGAMNDSAARMDLPSPHVTSAE